MEREQQLTDLQGVVRDLRVAADDLARVARALPSPSEDDPDKIRRISPVR